MKKILFILLISIFSLTACQKGEFVGEEGLYAYSASTKLFDEYVETHFPIHSTILTGSADDSIIVGKGIWVYGKDLPSVVYPVWKDGHIVTCYSVGNYNGQLYGTYYGDGKYESIDRLDFAVGKTNADHPLRLYKNDEGYYMILEDGIYSMTSPYEKIERFDLMIEIFTNFVLDTSKVYDITKPYNEY